MAGPYEIPYQPPDISKGAGMLIGVLQANRAHELAKRNADTQAAYAKNAEKRASAQEVRERHRFDLDEKDRRVKAVSSANELRRQGRHSEADMLLKLHGVQATPTIGPATTTAPEIVTPMAAAGSLKAGAEPGQPGATSEGPLAPEFAHSFATPMAAAANTMPRPQTGTGISVPEEPPAMPMVAPPEEDVMAMGPPSAERDLMPITLPGKTTPGQPTGAFTYKGPDGQDIGTFDPAEERQFRQERAARVEGALGPMGEEVTKIANLLAAGDIDQKAAGALLTALTSRENRTAKTNEREDKQSFDASQNELYKNEGLTFEQRMKLAEANGGSRIAAARAGNAFKQEGANDRLFSLLDRRAKAVRETGMFGKLATNDKVVRGIAANLTTGTEGLQHKDAMIQLARYFRQAQPTEGEMHLLYQNLGGWTDSFNQFKAKVTRGDLSPEQLRQMRKSAKTVIHEHEEDKKRFYQVARSGLGPGSGLDEVPDQAQKQFDMMAAELGIEPGSLPPLYETEGGVTLGTKKAPKTQPRGTKRTGLDELEDHVDSLIGGSH